VTKSFSDRLFSTKNLIRVILAVVNMGSIGTASAQGLPAGTMAPLYGTTWAAQARSHSLAMPGSASEPLNAGHMESSRMTESDVRLSSRETGGRYR
jgi:hypothetical protein